VDHRHDWTYALVLPRGHPLEAARAAESYRAVHACLVDSLRAQGVEAKLQTPQEGGGGAVGICFQRAEVSDVIQAVTGEKIAGAAQKRNKRGLLFQGSIWRPAAGGTVDWEKFEGAFTAGLMAMLDVEAERAPWPEFDEDEISGLAEKYASPEWLESR
jgi:lipoate-protein ligase A